MGLLDEAIREHLELKRRTGADPSAIARAEREALTPVFPDEPVDPDGNGDHSAHDSSAIAVPAPAGAVPVEDHRHGAAPLMDLSSVGQETAELDMRAVMEEDHYAPDSGPAAPILNGSVPAVHYGETPAGGSPEWEVPNEQDRESAPEDAPAQERLSLE
jgi:hypothetical protein